MTIAEQMRWLRDGLAAWARSQGGGVSLAGDQVQMIDLLRTKPAGVFVGVMFESETPRGENDFAGRVDRVFQVVLSRGRGFAADTGASLVDGAAGGPPLFDLIEQGREVVRGMRLEDPTGEERPVYLGAGSWEVQGFVLDAQVLRFQLAAQLPEELD